MLREASHFGRVVVTRPRPTAARRSLRKRNFMRILGLTTAAGMVAAFTVPSAFAAPDDDSEAQAHLINLDLNALGLEFDVLDAITTDSGYPSDEGANSDNIDVGILNALGLTIPGINLPLIGDGTNGGLLDLGAAAAAGLLNGYAASPSAVESLAASGAVGADGAIDVDAGSSTDPARVDLTGLLGQVGVDGLTDAIIDELSLELGALASRAEANEGDIEREYLLAGAELLVSSPMLGDLNTVLAETYGTTATVIEGTVNGLVGPEGAITEALDLIDLPKVNVLELARVEAQTPTATVDLALPPIDEVLTSEISSPDNLVTINLDSGLISVDVAKLVKGPAGEDLNGLTRDTEVLDADTIDQIVEGVGFALAELLDSVNEAVLETLHETELEISAALDVSLLAGIGSTTVGVTINGSLAGFAGLEGADAPTYETVTDITIGIITVPAGEIVNLVVEPLLASVTQALQPVTSNLLTAQSQVMVDALQTLVSPVLEILDPILDDVLTQLVSITINKQEDGADETDWHSVSALNLRLLPLLDSVVELDLAHSAVRALAEEEAVEASIDVQPGSVEVGDTITVDGTGFAPDSPVTVSFTDADGIEVGTVTANTDENGDFTADFVVPEDTALGDLTVFATDGENEATGFTTVVDDGGTDQDGTDQDGSDQDGSDQDGSDQDGSDQDGSDQDGSDQDGSDQDGSDQDGSDQDGCDQDGSDQDGSDQDGSDQDGADQDGSDQDGSDQDGSDQDGSDQDGSDQDGSDQDGSDQDGSDQDGSDQDGSDQDGSDQDGSDQDGSDQDGSDQDGSDQDGTDQDGSDQDGDGAEAGVVISPDEVEVGDTITVDGADFEPNATVVVTFTDADGTEVGTVSV